MGILEIAGAALVALVTGILAFAGGRWKGRGEGAKQERQDAFADDVRRANATRERVRNADRGQYESRGYRDGEGDL